MNENDYFVRNCGGGVRRAAAAAVWRRAVQVRTIKGNQGEGTERLACVAPPNSLPCSVWIVHSHSGIPSGVEIVRDFITKARPSSPARIRISFNVVFCIRCP